ncbi:hypothetical protein DFH09DRAFT_1161961 [Mycena vulgaris]|nr:hypothetical protein DFH09DRAFT_1161961 [Mycena vulgaris]
MASFGPLSALVALLLSSSTQVLAQSCACGYKDSNGQVWREAIVSDFTQASGALAAVDADWIVAADLQEQPTGISIQYATANVLEHQDALGLKASAYDNSGSVKSVVFGETILRLCLTEASNIHVGFFTYFSDTQEQDIEFLSSDSDYYQHLYYTNQPGQLPNSDPDPDAAKLVANRRSYRTFGVHRFDWLPTKTVYSYAGSNNGAPITSTTTITKNVPTSSAEFVLNVWSNGDPLFSKGPPTADAIATVHYVHLYFNSTTFSAGSFNTACSAAGSIAPCSV